MFKKKQIYFGLIITILIVSVTFFLYPLPLEKVVSSDHDLIVILTKNKIIDGIPDFETTEYRFTAKSDEIAQIKKILSKYTYHRNLRFFIKDDLMKGDDAGYWINLYSGSNSITIGGTGKIRINRFIYNIGYWGNKKFLSLMEDIRILLE